MVNIKIPHSEVRKNICKSEKFTLAENMFNNLIYKIYYLKNKYAILKI